MICEKCGAEMKEIISELSPGMKGPDGGWGWVTTSINPIVNDRTDYEIRIMPGCSQHIENIKLLAEIMGINFLKAKNLLGSNQPELVYKAHDESASALAKAQRVQHVAHRLKKAGVAFTITPDFPYDV